MLAPAIALETAGWPMFRSRAAAEKEPPSTTRTNISISRSLPIDPFPFGIDFITTNRLLAEARNVYAWFQIDRGGKMTTNSSTALITGGTSGIGRAAANKLAQLGIHVVVVGRNTNRGEKTVAEIRAAGGEADFISFDLRDASSAREVARRAVELGNGHVDILINNAGIFPFGPTHEMTEEMFDSVYSINVKAPYFLVAELAPLMAKRGKGAIVNVSTMVADYGMPGMSLYGSSKAAINLLTKAWAAEYGPSGVRVNAVSPGPTKTEGTQAMGEALDQLAAQGPAGRPATPDEIAEAIVFLATDRASFIHGVKLAVDGGRTAV